MTSPDFQPPDAEAERRVGRRLWRRHGFLGALLTALAVIALLRIDNDGPSVGVLAAVAVCLGYAGLWIFGIYGLQDYSAALQENRAVDDGGLRGSIATALAVAGIVVVFALESGQLFMLLTLGLGLAELAVAGFLVRWERGRHERIYVPTGDNSPIPRVLRRVPADR